MNILRSIVLQAATVIAKTVQTLIGAEVDATNGRYVTFTFAYVKGDETGLKITPYFLTSAGGTKIPVVEWSNTLGAYVGSPISITLTASQTASIKFDRTGYWGMRFEQGGSSNDGTPTGTLAASVTVANDE
jgi:hypothetical protein